MTTEDQVLVPEDGVGPAPLGFLFTLLDEGAVETVVKEALESRVQLPVGVRDTLNRALDTHVRVDGFRNAGAAPAPVILRQVCELVQSSPHLAGPVLRAWYETHPNLRSAVAALLEERDAIQAQIDAWHRERKGLPLDQERYGAFLGEIGYLLPEGEDFRVATADVDEQHVAGCTGVAPVEPPASLHKIGIEITVAVDVHQRRPATDDLRQQRQGTGHVTGAMRENEPALVGFVNERGRGRCGMGTGVVVRGARCQ